MEKYYKNIERRCVQEDQEQEEENKEVPILEPCLDDMEAAEKLYKLYPHWVYCKGKLYVFCRDNGTWSDQEKDHHQIIRLYKRHLGVIKRNRQGEVVPSLESYGGFLHHMRKIPPLMRILCENNDWLEQTHDSSLGKILFRNGTS